MRKMTINEIQSIITAKSQLVDYSVNIFRNNSEENGWIMKKKRPRGSDEIKALDYISRKSLLTAIEEGKFRYDKERRVLFIAKYSRS